MAIWEYKSIVQTVQLICFWLVISLVLNLPLESTVQPVLTESLWMLLCTWFIPLFNCGLNLWFWFHFGHILWTDATAISLGPDFANFELGVNCSPQVNLAYDPVGWAPVGIVYCYEMDHLVTDPVGTAYEARDRGTQNTIWAEP